MNLYLLFILDFMAELFHLTYQCGVLTRKYVIPCIVALYVCGEMMWDKLTSMEFTIVPTQQRFALVRA